ncbi:MAG: cupin domain-containing protein [Gemmataceae bacterium]|nr:cupin domain-containing protein [Gemmataceae bacterium]
MAPETHDGPNFCLAHLGETKDLRQYRFQHPALPVAAPGKVFLQELLGLTGMEISFGLMPPGRSMPFHHKHRNNEEVYLFLRGRGQFQIDGQVHDVREGTVIRVSPEGSRSWRNHSTEDLFYVCIQAKAGSIEGGTTTDGMGVPGPVIWPPQA